jgi:hypothetical protein
MTVALTYYLKRQCGNIRPFCRKCTNTFKLNTCAPVCTEGPITICLKPVIPVTTTLCGGACGEDYPAQWIAVFGFADDRAYDVGILTVLSVVVPVPLLCIRGLYPDRPLPDYSQLLPSAIAYDSITSGEFHSGIGDMTMSVIVHYVKSGVPHTWESRYASFTGTCEGPNVHVNFGSYIDGVFQGLDDGSIITLYAVPGAPSI